MRWTGRVTCLEWREGGAWRGFVVNPEGKMLLGRPRLTGWIILTLILRNQEGVVWSRFIWLRIGISAGLLCGRLWTFDFYNILNISCVAEQIWASKKGLTSMEFVWKPSVCLGRNWCVFSPSSFVWRERSELVFGRRLDGILGANLATLIKVFVVFLNYSRQMIG